MCVHARDIPYLRNQCLESDRLYDFTVDALEDDSSFVSTRFIARVGPGPCPWLIGISQADDQSFDRREV